jgi:GNAT superfamily N-acetyltransferase
MIVTSDVTITGFTLEDEANAVKMLVEKLPPSEREGACRWRIKRWRWQFYENPHNPDGKPLIWVARVDGKFAGMSCSVPISLRTPHGLRPAKWSVDYVVDSQMRGLGIGKKVLSAFTSHPAIGLAIGWTPVAGRVAFKVGFKLMWGFTNATLVLSRWRLGKQLVKAGRRRDLLRLARVFLRRIPRPGKGSLPVEITRKLPEGTDELWGQVAPRYDFCVDRDRKYLEWRFLSHPTHEYHFVRTGGPGTPAGMAVCRLTGDTPPMGIISDLIVDPQRQDVLVGLLDATVDFLKSWGAYAVSLSLPPALADRVLERYRCSLAQPLGMIVSTGDKDVEEAGIYTARHWYISRSDSDQDY